MGSVLMVFVPKYRKRVIVRKDTEIFGSSVPRVGGTKAHFFAQLKVGVHFGPK
jgi:hypothetical protein